MNHLDDAALIAVGNKLRSEIPPAVQSIFQRYMIPAMNVQERLMMLFGVKQAAPSEVFEGVCQLVKELLSPSEWEELKTKLEAGVA